MLGARIEKRSHQRRWHFAHRINLGIGEDPLATFISEGSHHKLGADVRQVSRLRTRGNFAFKLIALTGADHPQEHFAAELGDFDLPELVGTSCAQ